MKKFVVILAFILLGFTFFASNALAQTPSSTSTVSSSPQTLPLNTNPDVPQNINTYTQTTFINILGTATCFLAGYDPLSQDGKCLGINPTTRKIGYVDNGKGGLVALAGGLIGSTYNIPVSSVEYGRNLAANFGITRNSYAQTAEEICQKNNYTPEQYDAGDYQSCIKTYKAQQRDVTGFVGLTPILKIWQAFRNLVYLLFVLVFVVLGLGIMFRVNIDARTVMTIQNQIPKIIIALILITLSYAIAGLLIDIMYVSMHLIINLMASLGLDIGINLATNPVRAFGGSIGTIATDAAGGVGSIIGSLFEGNIGKVIATMVTTIVSTLVGSSIGGIFGLPGTIIGGAAGAIIGGVGGLVFGSDIISYTATIIAFLIIAIAIISVLFRVWFMLIKAYVFILLDIILAPFWIVKGIIPGAGGGVGPWFRSLLANLSAFPVVLFLFSLGRLIQDNFKNPTNAGGFVPPFIGDPGNIDAFGSLIGLGFILIMPEAVNITKQALKAPDLKIAGAAGRAIGIGQGFVSKPFGAIKSEFFGKDAFGNPRPATRFIGQNFGRLAAGFTGGTFEDKYGGSGFVLNPLTWNKRRRDRNDKIAAKKAADEAAEHQRDQEEAEIRRLRLESLRSNPSSEQQPEQEAPPPPTEGATGPEVATGPTDEAAGEEGAPPSPTEPTNEPNDEETGRTTT